MLRSIKPLSKPNKCCMTIRSGIFHFDSSLAFPQLPSLAFISVPTEAESTVKSGQVCFLDCLPDV